VIMGDPVTVTRLDPPVPVETPLGDALCIAWHDYGALTNQEWECILRGNRTIMFFPHQLVRWPKDYTNGIVGEALPFPPVPEYLAKLR
jgi:hypothetical protein